MNAQDARDDLFGPGPLGDPVSAMAPPPPTFVRAHGQVPAAPAPLGLPSAEGAYDVTAVVGDEV